MGLLKLLTAIFAVVVTADVPGTHGQGGEYGGPNDPPFRGSLGAENNLVRSAEWAGLAFLFDRLVEDLHGAVVVLVSHAQANLANL